MFVTVCDHFFDGSEENYSVLEELYAQHPEVKFLEFAYDEQELYGTYENIQRESPLWMRHWHNSSRFIAYCHLPEDIEYVLYVDVDEIFEPKKFLEWVEKFPYRDYDAVRFASYWYFREARYRATAFPDAALMVRKDLLSAKTIFNPHERMGILLSCEGKKQRCVKALDGQPMMHHFSWVRTQDEMMKKVQCWGHHWERDWSSLIQEEYKRNFDGVDFVRCYEYIEADPVLDPLKNSYKEIKNRISLDEHLQNLHRFPHVMRVTPQIVFRLALIKEFSL